MDEAFDLDASRGEKTVHTCDKDCKDCQFALFCSRGKEYKKINSKDHGPDRAISDFIYGRGEFDTAFEKLRPIEIEYYSLKYRDKIVQERVRLGLSPAQ